MIDCDQSKGMTMKRNLAVFQRLSLAAIAAIAATLCAAVPGAGRAAGTEDESAGIPDVVVTAQRRSESIQSVPLSVTAVDGASLEQMGLTRLSDLAREVPGLNVVSSGPGQNILIIRGIS